MWKLLKINIFRNNSELPDSFLQEEKIFQVRKAELSSQAMAFKNLHISANPSMIIYHNSAYQNMLKLKLLTLSLSTKPVFKN